MFDCHYNFKYRINCTYSFNENYYFFRTLEDVDIESIKNKTITIILWNISLFFINLVNCIKNSITIQTDVIKKRGKIMKKTENKKNIIIGCLIGGLVVLAGVIFAITSNKESKTNETLQTTGDIKKMLKTI